MTAKHERGKRAIVLAVMVFLVQRLGLAMFPGYDWWWVAFLGVGLLPVLWYVTPFEKAVREVERASESTLSIQHIAALKHHNKECGVCKELNKLMSQHMKPETRDNPNDVSRAKEQSNEAAERSYGH